MEGALDLHSLSSKTYTQRLSGVRSGKQLSELFDDFIGMAPLGCQLLGNFNPVRIGG